jgi:hypothetical protein
VNESEKTARTWVEIAAASSAHLRLRLAVVEGSALPEQSEQQEEAALIKTELTVRKHARPVSAAEALSFADGVRRQRRN